MGHRPQVGNPGFKVAFKGTEKILMSFKATELIPGDLEFKSSLNISFLLYFLHYRYLSFSGFFKERGIFSLVHRPLELALCSMYEYCKGDHSFIIG